MALTPFHSTRALTLTLLASATMLAATAKPPAAPIAPTATASAPASTPAPANPAIVPIDRKDPWWVQRHAALNARVKSAAEKGDAKVLFLGDSITQGWENEGKDTWAKHFAPRGAINLGIGGDRTQHVLWRLANGHTEGLARPAKGDAPALVVLMIGTNNTNSDAPEQIDAGVGAVLASLRERLPKAKVLLLAIFPRGEKPDDIFRQRVDATNALLAKRAASPGVTYLDIGKSFLEADGTIAKAIMPDALHLSPEGYARWAKAIESTVKTALGEP
jgi:lysophospholipase L1-like esterase